MAKILKAAFTATVLIALLSSCAGQAGLPKTDQPPATPVDDIITDLANPIWIGKPFKLSDAIWKFSNYRIMEKIGEKASSKEAFHVVDCDIDSPTPLGIDGIRFEMVDVFGNKFLPTANEELYQSFQGRIPFGMIPAMSNTSYKVTFIFEGLKKTQGLSIEILDTTQSPEKRIALIDMGI